jgi:nicotinate-nucleotide pyrophosphorylase (carboxylating)
MRMLEKEAVKIGGGMNHRIGLFDMILLKDNHIDFCGGVHNAISRAKQYCKEKGKDLKIECEVRNWKELEEALAEGCDRIMFDNFTPEDTAKAVKLVAGRAETESSGGITFDTMIPYAKAGVDFISFGALTHSVKGLDMSFKAKGSDKLIIK